MIEYCLRKNPKKKKSTVINTIIIECLFSRKKELKFRETDLKELVGDDLEKLVENFLKITITNKNEVRIK